MKYTDFQYWFAVMLLAIVWCSDACFGWERCSGHSRGFHDKETAHGILKTGGYSFIIIGLRSRCLLKRQQVLCVIQQTKHFVTNVTQICVAFIN